MAAAIGLDGFQKWFKTDKVTIDNWLFRLHHQVSFAILMVGLIFIFIENHLNGKSITCRGDDDYSNKFCWIHGTGHVAKSLQMKGVTNCMTNQEGTDDNEHKTTITYYLWLPFLLVGLLGLSKLSRTVWKSLEGGLIATLIRSNDGEKIGKEFLEKCNKRNKIKYRVYHIKYFLCEVLNVVAVLVSFWISDMLFNGKFWAYGGDVIDFMQMDPVTVEEQQIPDPKCTLFPTEVSCQVKTGSIVGAADEKNLLCILSNNIFNQHYFFAIYLWWSFLLNISGICLVFRVARIVIPDFSKRVFQFKHGNLSVVNNITGFSGADFFVLDRIAENLELEELEGVLDYIQESRGRSNQMGLVSLAGIEIGKDNRDMENLVTDNDTYKVID